MRNAQSFESGRREFAILVVMGKPPWELCSAAKRSLLLVMTEHLFEIGSDEAGDRVDYCLSKRLPLLSRTKLRALVSQGAATRLGRILSIGVRVAAGDKIVFRWEPELVPPGFPEKVPLDIVHEDESFVAVSKVAGMLVHPTRGVKRGTLTNALLAYLNPSLDATEVVREMGAPVTWPRFIHRLDRETSGIILVAKDQRSASAMGKALANGDFRKSYLAILCGVLSAESMNVTVPIARFDDAAPHWRASPEGQSARSIFEVLATYDGRSLCRLRPITGRTNQLRVHAASVDAPILGDRRYGGGVASRLMLHAHEIEFPHPASGNRMTLFAEPPLAMQEAWPRNWPIASCLAVV